jgi:hypothetical protein
MRVLGMYSWPFSNHVKPAFQRLFVAVPVASRLVLAQYRTD